MCRLIVVQETKMSDLYRVSKVESDGWVRWTEMRTKES